MSDDSLGADGRPRPPYVTAQRHSDRIKFRRALTLMLMTLLMPGSAQVVAGNKRIGRIALRIWLLIIVLAVAAALLAVSWRTSLFTLATNTAVLWVARLVVIGLAIAWAALFADAWRLGAPLELRRGHRLAMAGLNSVLCFATAGSLFLGAHVMAVQRDFISTVFGGHTVSEAVHGRYNVLLLGGDSGAGRWGLRPDSLTVASVDVDTGRTVLVGLPRNLANAPFPKGSRLQKHFPDGFDCDGCYLNSVNTWVLDHPDMFPEGKDAGIEATKATVEEATGLRINYYAMVNLAGFAKLVDAVGGVQLRVPERVPIGGIGAPITGYVPQGKHTLDGKQTLWFARSRVDNNDYSRMARQKCVMSAMLHQLNPRKVLMNVQRIASSSKQMLSTDIPDSELGGFIDLALRSKDAKISTVSIVPPAVNTSDPDYDEIRSMVADGIEKSENGGSGKPTTKKSRKAKKAESDDERSANINQSEDLASAC